MSTDKWVIRQSRRFISLQSTMSKRVTDLTFHHVIECTWPSLIMVIVKITFNFFYEAVELSSPYEFKPCTEIQLKIYYRYRIKLEFSKCLMDIVWTFLHRTLTIRWEEWLVSWLYRRDWVEISCGYYTGQLHQITQYGSIAHFLHIYTDGRIIFKMHRFVLS